MQRYRVHAYPIYRFATEWEASSPVEAANMADLYCEANEIYKQIPNRIEWAEDVEGFCVDTLDEKGEVVASVDLNKNFKPPVPDFTIDELTRLRYIVSHTGKHCYRETNDKQLYRKINQLLNNSY